MGQEKYLQLLEHSFEILPDIEGSSAPASRLQYLADYIFDFTTYDGVLSERFAARAIEACEAITNGTTFEYIKDSDRYQWFIVMCNMPFFQGRLEWGTSIRGAWWDIYPRTKYKLESCGIYEGWSQLSDGLEFEGPEWVEFIKAVCAFSRH